MTTLDTGTKLNQIAAVSRLLSGAAESDEVMIRTSGPTDIGSDGKVRRFSQVLWHSRDGKALPLSEIYASIDVVRVGWSFPMPSWSERVDALHAAAMLSVERVATKAAELAAAGKVTP
jgi:hypothetical protein